MSRKLQESRQPYEWAIANHRKAARLFDEELAPSGPEGPLEKPDITTEKVEEFESFYEKRIKAANQHMRLIAHLASDVARHVLEKEEGKALMDAAQKFMGEELDEDSEKNYVGKVFANTLRVLQ
jgi:hypothetical protein